MKTKFESLEPIKIQKNDYIEKDIQSYRWSDEFLVKDLAKRGIDQRDAEGLIAEVKQERKVSSKDSFFNDDVSETGGITGGLLVICWFIGGGRLLTFLSLARYSNAEYNRTIFNTMDLVSGGLYALLTLYAVVQMFRVKKNAVFLMKSLIIMFFFSICRRYYCFCNGHSVYYRQKLMG